MFLQNKMKKNIQMYFSTWLDYKDKPVMVLCKYLNNPVFPFSTSPTPLCEGVSPAVGSHNLRAKLKVVFDQSTARVPLI